MKFNAHIIASGNIETKMVFIGDASGLTNIPANQLAGVVPSGNLPSDVVYEADLLSTSGDLQSQIDGLTTGAHTTISGADGGLALSGNVIIDGLGAQVFASGAQLVIEPDVRRAELVLSSGVNTAVLTHGFGERPLVQFYDDSDCQVFADVFHDSVNQVRMEFLTLQTGRMIVVG